MRIGILETGDVVPELRVRYGDYPAMVRAALAPALPEASYCDVHLTAGEALPRPQAAGAWLITGSRHGVYDDLPWMEPLKAFLRDCRAAWRPIAGICFGHQILAEALGGRAGLYDKGWSVGRRSYTVQRQPGWMRPRRDSYEGLALHRDQVTGLAPDATVLAGSDFCPYAALSYGDPERPDAISVQSHPEFTTGFLRDLVEVRRGSVLPETVADTALSSLNAAPLSDGSPWPGWIAGYFRGRSNER